MKHCHEIDRRDDQLYLTSTGFDSILKFDLSDERFTRGYHLYFESLPKIINGCCSKGVGLLSLLNGFKIANKIIFRPKPKIESFNPEEDDGPNRKDTLHINNVFVDGHKIFLTGIKIGHLLYIDKDEVKSHNPIPYTTHNARPFREGLIANLTSSNKILYLNLKNHTALTFDIIRYPEDKLLNSELPKDHARQAFGRGLVVTKDGFVIGGSSPATISVYDLEKKKPVKTVNITMDIRNAIHGLEIWPY